MYTLKQREKHLLFWSQEYLPIHTAAIFLQPIQVFKGCKRFDGMLQTEEQLSLHRDIERDHAALYCMLVEMVSSDKVHETDSLRIIILLTKAKG